MENAWKKLKSKLGARIVDRVLRAIDASPRLAFQFDITRECNLACPHCYQGAGGMGERELSLADWEMVLENCDRLLSRLRRTPSIAISGGEPFLSDRLFPLVEMIVAKWPEANIGILTNGTLVDDAAIRSLSRGRAEIQISLDGPDAERHDVVRGTGNFLRSVDAIRRLVQNGISVTGAAVLSNRTAQWIAEFFGLACDLRLDCLGFTRLIPTGRGRALVGDGKEKPLVGLQLRDAYREIHRESIRCGIPTNTNEALFCLIDPSLGCHEKFGFQGFVIDSQGHVQVSSRSQFCIGDVLSEDLTQIFLEHPLLCDLRQGKIEECGGCEFYQRCGGNRNAAFAEFGSFLAPDPGCWIRLKQSSEVL